MRCYYHTDQESVQACSVCRKFLCPACSHSIKGSIYCQDCLVAGADLAALATSQRLASYSPGRAAAFALIPGIGAVYNRQYTKAVLHFSVFAALMLFAEQGPGVFGLGAFVWYIYTIIDAYRSAETILRRQVTQPDVEDEESQEINLPLWGGVLVLLGMMFFLNNLGVFNLGQMTRFVWPLLFVALGVYLIAQYLAARPEPPRSPAPPPAHVPQNREESL
jgi:hypothetical protein